jgi:hypothetical protein
MNKCIRCGKRIELDDICEIFHQLPSLRDPNNCSTMYAISSYWGKGKHITQEEVREDDMSKETDA